MGGVGWSSPGGAGHLIGTDADGVNDAAERNVISGNVGAGISMEGHVPMNNIVAGNYIGTDATGTVAIPNGGSGVVFTGNAITIGGSNPAARNIISGNHGTGLGVGTGSSNVIVQGNYIGTDVTGTVPLGNGVNGVAMGGGSGNILGTNADGVNDAAERNVISGNVGAGIVVGGPNVVAGNYIGTNAAGTAAIPNGGTGVSLFNGQFIRIGTNGDGINDAAERNLISGNNGSGVSISPLRVGVIDHHTIAGNYIGTDVTGTLPLPNRINGVRIFTIAGATSPNNHQIGGPGAMGNIIAFNLQSGVVVRDTNTVNNRITNNSIHSNGGLGIDLGENGITNNDTLDADSGANQLQNFPVITSATAGPSTQINGTLNSLANTTFTLEFFANSVADPTGFGEGQRFLGSTTVLTNGSGNASFSVTLAAASTGGEVITATATSPTGNTSEFPRATATPANTAPTAEAGGPYTAAEDGSVMLNGLGSFDNEQINTSLIYEWDLDGDGIYCETGPSAVNGDEVGPTPTFVANGLDGPGSVIVRLRVTDMGGLTSNDTATVNITNSAPTATLGAASPINEGSSGTVSFTNPFDFSNADTTAGFRYAYDLDNNGLFETGDGTYAGSSTSASAAVPASLLADGPGSRTVRARIIDKDNGFTDYTAVIQIDNVAPTATLGNSGPVNEGSTATVSFSAQ